MAAAPSTVRDERTQTIVLTSGVVDIGSRKEAVEWPRSLPERIRRSRR
jgi:hypothetical protein